MIKAALKKVLLEVKGPRIAQNVVPNRILVLRYHSVSDAPDLLDCYISSAIAHQTDVFRAQMEYLARHCQVVTMDQVYDIVHSQSPIPKRTVCITFDDGYRDNYEIAAPILEKLGFRGTFYVSTAGIEGESLWYLRLKYWKHRLAKSREEYLATAKKCAVLPEPARQELFQLLEGGHTIPNRLMMNWHQTSELVSRGHVVGSHTVYHTNVAQVPSGQATHELFDSKDILEKRLGMEIRHFSYPNPILDPHWNEETIGICRSAGYLTAVTSTGGSVRHGTNILAMPRLRVPATLDEFIWSLEMGFGGWIA